MLAIAVASAMSGCAVGPESSPPAAVAASGEFIETRVGEASAAAVPENWWRLFDEPLLDGHVNRALAANTDLRIAAANLQVSRATLAQARAAYFPATVLESGAGPEPADRQPSTSSVPKTSYEFAGTLAYEVDLFGRLRKTASAARAEAEASGAARDAAQVMVIADTVTAYINLCGATARANIVREQMEAQQRSVNLVSTQLREGEVSPLELSQARALLGRIRSTLYPLEADRRRALYVLATLQGMAPAEADEMKVSCERPPRISGELPAGDAAALIARRPDIREAERKLAAATARLGVATADLYPRVFLGGSAGRIGGGWDGIVTPLITWSFPNQSVARAKIAAGKGAEAAALATWDAAILRALREVETVLADYNAESQRRMALETSLTESSSAATRARARYRLGADSYLLVLDAERLRNDAASERAASDTRIALLQAALFRALGSGGRAEMERTTSAPP